MPEEDEIIEEGVDSDEDDAAPAVEAPEDDAAPAVEAPEDDAAPAVEAPVAPGNGFIVPAQPGMVEPIVVEGDHDAYHSITRTGRTAIHPSER